MNTMHTQRGFTLIELLLYVSISALLLLAISVFLSTLVESRIKNQIIAEVDQQGVQVMQQITQALRNADAVNSPTLGTSAGALSLNSIIAGNNPTIFDLASGVIRITEGAGAAVPLTNARITISALQFTNLSRANTPDTIQITFTVSAVNPSGRSEYSYQQTFTGSATLRQP